MNDANTAINEYFDYFQNDANRTFPEPTQELADCLNSLFAETIDDVALKTFHHLIMSSAWSDILKSKVFYKKEKKFSSVIDELVNYDYVNDLSVNIKSVNVLHGLFGVASETGELCKAILEGLQNNEKFDKANITEEIGDILVYLAVIANGFGINLKDAIDTNIAKRAIRFPNGFTTFHATNRDLEKERKCIESGVNGC